MVWQNPPKNVQNYSTLTSMQKVLNQLNAHNVQQTVVDGELVATAQLVDPRQIQLIKQQQ